MSDRFDVICIGAALVDMVAKVERHPVEDDEVFVSDLTLLSGGAAANTAFACAKLGLNSAFIGKLGPHDEFGGKIIEDFKEVSLDTSLIKYSDDYGTGSAYVALNPKGDRRIYAHSGAANYLFKEDIVPNEIKQARVIFLSSLKNIDPFIEAAKIAQEQEIPVILNPGMLIIDQGLENIKVLLEKLDILILSQREYVTLLSIQEGVLDDKLIQKTSNALLNLDIKFIISGSSSLQIKKTVKETLTGRKQVFQLEKFSFNEFLKFKGKEKLLEKKMFKYALNEMSSLFEEYLILIGSLIQGCSLL